MIEVKNLTKRYGKFTAVRDVNFEVEKGEILGFLGPNAAGKTTTMRILTCFMPASEGTARVAGYDRLKNLWKYVAMWATSRKMRRYILICGLNRIWNLWPK